MSIPPKKAMWILLPCFTLLILALLGLRSFGRRFWEATLDGPFTGAPYMGSVTTAPVSVFPVLSHGQLEVYEPPFLTNPVVLLRSISGQTQWSRLFMPEKKEADGTIRHAGIRDLRLKSLENRNTGLVVFVTCDWDWGGKEAGLIYLDTEYGFKGFSLSW